jgi:hypothetical protein
MSPGPTFREQVNASSGANVSYKEDPVWVFRLSGTKGGNVVRVEHG